jgi:hypothetical protein
MVIPPDIPQATRGTTGAHRLDGPPDLTVRIAGVVR